MGKRLPDVLVLQIQVQVLHTAMYRHNICTSLVWQVDLYIHMGRKKKKKASGFNHYSVNVGGKVIFICLLFIIVTSEDKGL